MFSTRGLYRSGRPQRLPLTGREELAPSLALPALRNSGSLKSQLIPLHART